MATTSISECQKEVWITHPSSNRLIRWEVESCLEYRLQPARPYTFISNGSQYGRSEGVKGIWSYTLFIQNGHVKRKHTPGLHTLADDSIRRDVEDIEFRLTSYPGLHDHG
ncbi:hypothetical protein BCR33DRAFT_711924, partial [Rhizoclosmatium globosum]